MAPEASMFVTMYIVPVTAGIVAGFASPAEWGRQKRFLAGVSVAAVALLAIFLFYKVRPHAHRRIVDTAISRISSNS